MLEKGHVHTHRQDESVAGAAAEAVGNHIELQEVVDTPNWSKQD